MTRVRIAGSRLRAVDETRREPTASQTRQDCLLAECLTTLHDTYDIRYLDPDPLAIVRRFRDPRDQEIAGLLAAGVAFGGVRSIMADVANLFARMDDAPWETVRRFDPARDAGRFDGWYHRLLKGPDIAALCWAMRRTMDAYGSLGALFARFFDPSHDDIAPALVRFTDHLRRLDPAPITPGAHFRHLLSSPADGSACKRMNLYLRWMVRRESPDLGLWRDVPPSHLVMPVDTHVARICRNIGLTTRRTVNWSMAREITDALRAIDARDPVKFDYALCRLGILDHCPRLQDPVKCAACPVGDACIL